MQFDDITKECGIMGAAVYTVKQPVLLLKIYLTWIVFMDKIMYASLTHVSMFSRLCQLPVSVSDLKWQISLCEHGTSTQINKTNNTGPIVFIHFNVWMTYYTFSWVIKGRNGTFSSSSFAFKMLSAYRMLTDGKTEDLATFTQYTANIIESLVSCSAK